MSLNIILVLAIITIVLFILSWFSVKRVWQLTKKINQLTEQINNERDIYESISSIDKEAAKNEEKITTGTIDERIDNSIELMSKLKKKRNNPS